MAKIMIDIGKMPVKYVSIIIKTLEYAVENSIWCLDNRELYQAAHIKDVLKERKYGNLKVEFDDFK